MKVKELIEELKKEDPEKDIILQKDPEGNGYSLISGVDGYCVYRTDDYENTVYDTRWNAHDAGFDSEKEWSTFKNNNENCVVLYPMH